MRKATVIPIEKFQEAYRKVGWVESRSKDGKYYIWANSSDKTLWTQLPVNEDAVDYSFYAKQNIKMLLYVLSMPENEHSIDEIISQLRGYNYKLVNRIVGNSEFKSDSVPYELATTLPQKNIEAFRHFFLTHKSTKGSIPIEKFQMNHTEVGSFVIPVSILVEEDANETLAAVQTETNHLLHDYLKMVDKLVGFTPSDPEQYAKKIVEANIDSKIVKDFLGKANSIAKATEKYKDQISGVTISGTGSPLLDYRLKDEDKKFTVVNISRINTIEDEYIKEIERLELKADENRVEEADAEIDVVVDAIERGGNVKFTVTAINGKAIKKPFKANSTKLSKARLDIFAESFKNEGATIVRGDISKAKGKMGQIIIDTIGEKREDNNLKLV